MEFTGERVIPDDHEHRHLYFEHIARYGYSGLFVKGKKVLDVGCGTGYGGAYLAGQGATLVTGIDISDIAICYAKERFNVDNLNFLLADATEIPFPDHSFDLCVSFEVIEHIENDVAFLEEIKRVLDPLGVLVLSTPNKAKSSPNSPNPTNPYHQREYQFDELYALLSSQFSSVQIFGQYYSEGFRFCKRGNEDNHGNINSNNKALYLSLDLLPYDSRVDEPDIYNSKTVSENLGEPDYFFAICSMAKLPDQGVTSVALAGMDTIQRKLADRDQWIKILQGEKNARDFRIKELEDMVFDREKWIEILQNEKNNGLERIRDLEDTLQERENWIGILIEEKDTRDSHIDMLRRDVENRNMQIKEFSEDINRQELKNSQHVRDNEINLMKIEELTKELGSRSEELTLKDKIIKEYDARIINRIINALRRRK